MGFKTEEQMAHVKDYGQRDISSKAGPKHFSNFEVSKKREAGRIW